jgi:hypothetical protein
VESASISSPILTRALFRLRFVERLLYRSANPFSAMPTQQDVGGSGLGMDVIEPMTGMTRVAIGIVRSVGTIMNEIL